MTKPAADATAGTLILVATPVGHRGDLSPRALDVLGAVALVAAEDTRLTGSLLAHFGLKKKKAMVSCFEHNERQRTEQIVSVLARGEDVALVSSAGSPAISDPGFHVVRAALDIGADVVAVPGACAAILALQVSGLPTDTFTFVGFFPKRAGKRRAFLERALDAPGTTIAYVPARDTAKVLDELAALAAARSLAPPRVAVARELTKVHEEVLRGAADEVARRITRRVAEGGVWRGEVTLVVAAGEQSAASPDDDALARLLDEALAAGLDGKAALREVRERTGVPRKRLYGILEELKRDEDGAR